MFQDILQSLLSRQIDILIGFSIPVILGICKFLLDKVTLSKNKQKNNFTLDGIWCSIHKNFKKDDLIEFVRIKYRKNNHVSFSIKQIRQNNQIRNFVGSGIKINNFLYLIYESVSGNDSRGGIFMLQIKNRLNMCDYLVGIYLESGSEKQDQKLEFTPTDGYRLYPISTSNLLYKIKHSFTIHRLKKFTDAKKFIEKLCETKDV